jgi:hypothetical protein
LFTIPAAVGGPTASAQVPGITTCPQGTFIEANVNCSTFATVFCPGGGLAGPQQACPINPPAPSPLNTPSVTVNLSQTCANGIVISVTQTCPNGVVTLTTCPNGLSVPAGQQCSVKTTTAAAALQKGSGQYCDLPNGGQVWVPSGASPADMGCKT